MPAAKFLAPLCHEIWPSETMIPTIKSIPILFLSGLRDEIVPYVVFVLTQTVQTNLTTRPPHMKKLHDLAQVPIKIWRELPHGDHNNSVAEAGYFHFVDDFIKLHVVDSKTSRSM